MNARFPLYPSRGFTLMETVIVIFIVSIVMMGISALFINFNNSYAIQNGMINNAYSASQFLNETGKLALQARSIVGTRSFAGISYTTSSSTLILEIPSVANSGDIVANTYDYALIKLSSSTVHRTLEANASSARVSGTKQLSDAVTSLAFTYNNATPSQASRITIDITTQTTVKQKVTQTHLTQQVYLRNN
jgi:prepilin-type N-terminal cleavage/methylation domain-containing protein